MGDNKLALTSMEDLREVCLGKAGIKINEEFAELKKLYEDSKARERYWREKLDERVDAEAYKKLEEKYEKLKKDYALTDPRILDSLQRQCNELIGKNAALESIEERYDSLMKRYMDLDRKYGALRDENRLLQNAVKDNVKDKESSVGYKSYEELHADIEKFEKYLLTEEKFKRDRLPTFTDHLIDEAVEKYEFLKGLLTLIFFIAPIVLSWNYGAIYLLLFIPLLVVRLLPSEETVKVFLVDYYKRKENE